MQGGDPAGRELFFPPCRKHGDGFSPGRRMIEWFGLEETLKTIQIIHPPAVGRDPFHYPHGEEFLLYI